MKTIIGLVLIGAGAALFIQGLNRQDSVVGRAAEVGAKLASQLDGGTRTPRHVGLMVGGAALALAGIVVLAKRPAP